MDDERWEAGGAGSPATPPPGDGVQPRPRGRWRLKLVAAVLAGACVATALAFVTRTEERDRAWAVVDLPTMRATQTNFFFHSITTDGDTGAWLVSGYQVVPAGERLPTVWSSANGREWHAEVLPESPDWRGSATAGAIATRGELTVAVGQVRGADGTQLVVWRKEGLGSWALADDPVVAGLRGGRESFPQLGAGAIGFVLATVEAGQGSSDPLAVLHSADGANWSRSAIPAFPDDDMVPADIVVGPAGAMIVGTSSRGAAVLWSPDGQVWQPEAIPTPGAQTEGTWGLSSIVFNAGRFVASGWFQPPGEFGMTMILEGLPGQWRADTPLADEPPGVQLGTQPTLASDDSGEGTIYLATLLGGEGKVWSSSDARRWTQEATAEGMGVWRGRGFESLSLVQDALPRALPAHRLTSVFATDSGFLAMGGRSQHSQFDVGIWHSTDGKSWSVSPVLDSPVTGYQALNGATVGSDRTAVLVGSFGLGGAIWVGPVSTLVPVQPVS